MLYHLKNRLDEDPATAVSPEGTAVAIFLL